MKTLALLFVLFIVSPANAQLERGASWRWDAAYGYAEVKVNDAHVKPQSPNYKYDPKFETSKTGFQASEAHGKVTAGVAGADAWSNAVSSLGSSLVSPAIDIGHGYSTLCVTPSPPQGHANTRAKAHASGTSNSWAKYKHPGGNMTGKLKLTGEVDKKDSDFKGEMYVQLGDNILTAKYNTVRKGWDVTGVVNGRPVNKEYGRSFSDSWNTVQNMGADSWFTMKGRMNGTGGVDFLMYGLKTSADNFGSGSVPVRIDGAKMQLRVQVNP